MKHLYTISHIEIPAPDFNRTVEFYTKVFNWNIELVTIDHYAFFTIGDTNSGGSFDASLQPAPEKAGPQLVISCDSMEEAMMAIQKHGGTIIKEKTEIPGNHGFYCVFQDPNKNFIQLHSRK